jgi:DNA-binding winged helix-turn-helix (wHTH) protein
MRQANDSSGWLRFAVFEVDLRAGELTKRGLRIRLQEQPFQVLAMLLEKPGELVTREELREKIWGHTVVDFDHGLNKAINKIREALGDSAASPRFVETVARRGYRFLADVTPFDAAADRQPGAKTEGLVPPTESHPVELADAGVSPDVGILQSTNGNLYYGGPKRLLDGRIGIGIDLEPFNVQLSWVGINAATAAYGVTGVRSRNGPVLTLLRSF